jgi:hypothetical protein
MERELVALRIVQVIGYGNVLVLLYAIVAMKAADASSVAFAAASSVALVGTLCYYTFWNRIFRSTERAKGRTFLRPYLLGTAISAGTLCIVLGLTIVASYGT